MNVIFLRRASIFYLLIPNALFFSFWTGGVFRILGLILCAYIIWNELRNQEYSNQDKFTVRNFTVIALFALLITYVSGVSGLSYQTFDYWCHNTKFYELFKYDWPIRIPADGPVIAYYYGFYLVPALYSKLIGELSEAAIFLWTFAGFFLGISWLYLILHKNILLVFVALTIGDLPHVFKTIYYKFNGYLYEFGDFGVEAWSNFENLLWVPNQVIPSLIIGGMLVYTVREKVAIERVVLPVALSFWWAVFPAFTSGLLVGILVLVKWFQHRLTFDVRRALNDVLLPSVCCLPVLILFLSHNQAPISGFIWQFPDRMDSRVIEYLINIGINAVVFYLGYRFLNAYKTHTIAILPFYLAMTFFLIFPIYRIGKVNDFLFRGLMPLLIIIGLYLYENLTSPDGSAPLFKKIKKAPILAVLMCLMLGSSLIGIGRIVRSLRISRMANQLNLNDTKFEPIPYDSYPNIYEVLKDKWSQMEADQYLGKEDSIYELIIAPTQK